MPAVASLEDLESARKDLLEAKDLSELKAVFKKWHRIGWKNVCGAPMGRGRAIQRLGGGDIPAPSEWSSLPGQAVVTGTDPLRPCALRLTAVNSRHAQCAMRFARS
jgi:hypothetical protein